MIPFWNNDGDRWQLFAPSGFTAEAALHNLVAPTPCVVNAFATPNAFNSIRVWSQFLNRTRGLMGG